MATMHRNRKCIYDKVKCGEKYYLCVRRVEVSKQLIAILYYTFHGKTRKWVSLQMFILFSCSIEQLVNYYELLHVLSIEYTLIY